MDHRGAWISITTIVAVAALFPASVFGGRSCESLTSPKLPNTMITKAESVPAGPFPLANPFGGPPTQVSLPAFCRVTGQIQPAPDSDIRFEVWLPTENWNGKFAGTDNGGFAGYINYGALAAALRAGFAAASTDTGHAAGGPPAAWALGHPEKIIDFGYRAIHLTTVTGKAMVSNYYGVAPHWSYFSGCSNGGRQGLMEAQQFPADYDGIVAGAPANFWTHLMASAVWDLEATLNNPASYIPPNKLPALGNAVFAACDALDGIKDGILNDPRQCHFNPETLLCAGADSSDCLTAPQVAAAKKIYAGPSDSQGQSILPGYMPGSESGFGGWGMWITGPAPEKSVDYSFGTQFFSNMVFDDPAWNFRTFNFDADLNLTDKKVGPILNATNPKLTDFEARGGKLILYHGWSDSAIPPLNTVNYYQSVVAAMGREPVEEFVRLYMVPGVGHCGGGPGPDTFGAGPVEGADPEHSLFSSLEQWVERGAPPKAIIAAKRASPFNPASAVEMTRPLCPYPEVAKYKGSGDIHQAANFVCALEPNNSAKASSVYDAAK